jgi:hypothetical protein
MSEIQQLSDISSITNKPISLTDDQGINPQPFIKNDGLNLNSFDGLGPNQYDFDVDDGTYIKKKEISNMFTPSVTTNVFGQTHDGAHAQKDRYDSGRYRNYEKSTERQYVAPIDEKSRENRNIANLIASRSHIDNIRSEVNKKDNYKGRIKAGKSIGENRGIQPGVDKNKPYRDYQNSPDRYFISVNGTHSSIRPEFVDKFTNRSIFNNNIITNAKTYVTNPEKFQSAQLSHRQQLDTSNGRNFVGNNTSQNFYDYDKLGYKVYPNEREVTSENIQRNNATTYIDKPMIGYSDESSLGYVDKPKGSLKQTTLYSDLLNSKTTINTDMSRDNLDTYTTDPTKELLSTGREPTLSNVKLMSGVDRFNTETKKLNDDYMTQHQSGITNIFSNISTSNDNKNTRDKITLNNQKLSDRISPDLLDPFRNNPLTQPLTSYAYS